jgi:hypothetical protein
MRITLLLFFLSFINAQIALPTFQAVHTPQTAEAESGSQTFSYTGSAQTFTVPSGVSTITIKVWGAQGGSGGYWSSSYCGTGGKGGYATGTLSVTAGNSDGVGSTGIENLTGGGYYGGGVGVNSTGGGGSGYIGGVSSAETIAGNATMPDPDSGTMTGREGNGLVVISW